MHHIIEAFRTGRIELPTARKEDAPNRSSRQRVRGSSELAGLCQQDGQQERARRQEQRNNHGNERELFSSWRSPGGKRRRNACGKECLGRVLPLLALLL